MINKFVKSTLFRTTTRLLSTNEFLDSFERKTTTDHGRKELQGLKSVFSVSSSDYESKPIDFNDYRKTLVTPGIVDKLEAIYKQSQHVEFTEPSASTVSEQIQSVQNTLNYVHSINKWNIVIQDENLEKLSRAKNFGEATDLELMAMLPEARTEVEMHTFFHEQGWQNNGKLDVMSDFVDQFDGAFKGMHRMQHQVSSRNPAQVWYGENQELHTQATLPFRESSATDTLDQFKPGQNQYGKP